MRSMPSSSRNASTVKPVSVVSTIARIVANGESIYGRRLTFAEARQRIDNYYRPYHDALRRTITETKVKFGHCLLIDCHSMPTHPAQAGNPPDFVLGDAHCTACAPRATRLAEQVLAGLGYRVRRNDPYAGGYVTRHYGRPREGVHALQVEVARPLYMDEARIERLPHMAALQADLTRLIGALTTADWSALR